MDEMSVVRFFSITEANQLLPELTDYILAIQSQRIILLNLEAEIDAMELVADPKEKSASPALSCKVQDYNDQMRQFYALVEKIHILGCYLKDADIGLVDFYSRYEGKVVHLCWKMGEKEVCHWHEIGSGYTSRQPLYPHRNTADFS